MKRLEAIDQFRGFAIFLMILANYINNVQIIPAWLKHADDIGYTIIDLIAPMFVFAMGLTYGGSFRRRLAQDGAWNTYQHFLTRYLALLGLGYIITLVWELSGIQPPSVNWGLLQALGAAGLLALPFIRLSPVWRGVIGLGILGAYQILLDRFWLEEVLIAPHNGPWGALSWGAMLILATALGDVYLDERVNRRAFPLLSAGLVVAGLALALLISLSKDRASASYVILSLGLSGLVFYLFHWMQERWQLKLPILTDWGRNPLLLYLLHYVLLAIFALPPYPLWYVQAPWWLVILQMMAMIAILSWVGRYLNQRKLYFVL
jgi:predicted acyltransferase